MNNSPDSKESGVFMFILLIIRILEKILKLEIHENQLIKVAEFRM